MAKTWQKNFETYAAFLSSYVPNGTILSMVTQPLGSLDLEFMRHTARAT